MSERPASRLASRLPLLAIAMLSMACGVWLGLLRLGWALPLPWTDSLIGHGPLMIGGFLGTLIGLERAVALQGHRWAYAAPVLTVSGALLLELGPAEPLGALLITLGSGVLVAIFLVLSWREPSWSVLTMALGAVGWVAGNVQWLAGFAIFRVVFWWLAFLVLTIAGERLELNRVLRPTRASRLAFAASVAILLIGVSLTAVRPVAGVRMVGLALVLLTWWLWSYDVARHTVRQAGVTRFIATCLLSGYAWLGVGGFLAAATGAASPGTSYDAVLHAVFVGFVLSMVFGHAPVIFPAVLGLPLPYRPLFYAHLGLLHASLALRILGDLVDTLGRWRGWGGLLNAFVLVLFVANTVWSIVMGLPRRSRMTPKAASGSQSEAYGHRVG